MRRMRTEIWSSTRNRRKSSNASIANFWRASAWTRFQPVWRLTGFSRLTKAAADTAVFQSTLSVRRMTWVKHPAPGVRILFQSTFSVRRMTQASCKGSLFGNISIHIPSKGSDRSSKSSGYSHRTFQSTLPAKGATANNLPKYALLTQTSHIDFSYAP